MKSKNIFWGIFFITLGLFFILDLNEIEVINLEQILELWPLFLILIGLKILIKNNLIADISLALASIFFALIIYTFIFSPISCHGVRFYKDREWKERTNESISYQFNPKIKNANLYLEFEAGEMKLNSNGEKLIDGEINFIKKYNYFFDGEVNDSTAKFRLESRNDKSIIFKIPNEKYKNYLNLKLHPDANWDIDIYTNRSKCFINLSTSKIKNFQFNGIFSKSEIELGTPPSNLNINFDVNFCRLKISLPEDVEYEVKIDKNFSSLDFKDLVKIDDHTYRTKKFDESPNKYRIQISANFSSISLN